MIKLNSIEKVYETGGGRFTALSVNLEIAKGEFAVVTGCSGSGKSTLLNILAGIDRPTSGNIQISGESILCLNESQMSEWRGKTMGIVFQFFQLMSNLSVIENVLLPMDLMQKKKNTKSITDAMRLLEKVGMQNHADKMPSELSGGEQQRVAIARSLANQVPILLADEPTGNLDSENSRAILDLFTSLASEGKTIIMVTHEQERIKGATRQIVLKDGIVVADLDLSAGGDEIGSAH